MGLLGLRGGLEGLEEEEPIVWRLGVVGWLGHAFVGTEFYGVSESRLFSMSVCL